MMVFAQVRAVHQMKEEALPAIGKLPALEARLTALQEQVELMELQRLISTGQQDELIRAYVVPDKPDLDRLLATLDVLSTNLKAADGIRSVSPIRVGEAETVALPDGTLQVFPIDLEIVATEAGKEEFLDAVALTGVLTVSDALPPAETATLMKLTEQENPAGIAALEQHFLAVDLLRYVREHKAFESRLEASFPSDAFRDSFAAVQASSVLSDARRLLAGDLGDTLQEQGLWPMRLLDVEKASVESVGKDEVKLTVRLRAYARGQ